MIKNHSLLVVLIFLLILLSSVVSESKTPEIILENGFYYVVQPNGEKVAIVREQEPGALNKAQLSPNGQYIIYTTYNGLGFESGGRDLFYCKTDGTARTFLHKFELYIDYWVWLSKDDRDFLVVHAMEGKVWVLEFNKKKLLFSFTSDSVEKIEGKECCKAFGMKAGIMKGEEICADQLTQITDKDVAGPELYVNWMGDQVYLSNKQYSIFGSDDILTCFEPVYDLLSMQERSSYREIHHRLSEHIASFAEEPFSLARNKIVFSIGGMHGQYDLHKRKVEMLDIGGDLSLKLFCSPKGKYMAILKTEPSKAKKIIILNKGKDATWKNTLTKKFSANATLSNLEWSKQDETKIYYSLKEGDLSKDSCLIDLTEIEKTDK